MIKMLKRLWFETLCELFCIHTGTIEKPYCKRCGMHIVDQYGGR